MQYSLGWPRTNIDHECAPSADRRTCSSARPEIIASSACRLISGSTVLVNTASIIRPPESLTWQRSSTQRIASSSYSSVAP